MLGCEKLFKNPGGRYKCVMANFDDDDDDENKKKKNPIFS